MTYAENAEPVSTGRRRSFVVLFIFAIPSVAIAASGKPQLWPAAAVLIGIVAAVLSVGGPTGQRRRSRLVPRDLPAPPRRLVGRAEELAELADMLTHGNSGTGARIVLLTGAPGVGKTALALQAAHMTARQFPDGQIYARFTPQGSTDDQVEHALREFVQALRGPRDEPSTDAPLAEQYKALTAKRRVLVLLDDVRTAEQVSRLTPAGRHSVVLVTSRIPAAELPHDRHLAVFPLCERDSLAMLSPVVDPDADRAREHLRGIAQATKGYPLALQVAGVRLAGRQYVTLTRATDPPTPTGGPAAFRHALDPIYALLAEEEQRALTLLAIPDPSETLAPWKLTALAYPGDRATDADVSEAREREAERIMDRLVWSGLLERTSEDAAGVSTFQMPDHVHEYARRRVDESPGDWQPDERMRSLERAAEIRRIQHADSGRTYGYLHAGDIATAMRQARDDLAQATEAGEESARGRAYAALAEISVELGSIEEARDLARLATRPGSDSVRAHASRCIGKSHRRLRQLPDAERHLHEAKGWAERSGDVGEQARVLLELALTEALREDPRAAERLVDAAEDLRARMADTLPAEAEHLAPGVLLVRAVVLRAVGQSGFSTAEPASKLLQRADVLLAEAISVSVAAGMRLWLAWSWQTRARLALSTGRYEDCHAYARLALEEFAAMSHRYGVAQCRLLFGQSYLGEGRLDEAIQTLEEAAETFHNCGDRWADAETTFVLAQARLKVDATPDIAVRLFEASQRIFGFLGDERSWQLVTTELSRVSSGYLYARHQPVPDPAAALTVSAGS